MPAAKNPASPSVLPKCRNSILVIRDLGNETDYRTTLALQEELHAARVVDTIPDTLLLLEHRAVYTMGRSANPAHILRAPHELAKLGIHDVCQTSRGGDVTYHGPGQLVGYPIIHLSERRLRVVPYVSALEEVIIRTLSTYGISSGRDERNRGVWIGNAKIAALGIRVSRQVAMHGFALNVNTRLDHYNAMVPCGLQNTSVVSMKSVLGREVPMDELKSRLIDEFCAVFNYERPDASLSAN